MKAKRFIPVLLLASFLLVGCDSGDIKPADLVKYAQETYTAIPTSCQVNAVDGEEKITLPDDYSDAGLDADNGRLIYATVTNAFVTNDVVEENSLVSYATSFENRLSAFDGSANLYTIDREAKTVSIQSDIYKGYDMAGYEYGMAADVQISFNGSGYLSTITIELVVTTNMGRAENNMKASAFYYRTFEFTVTYQ